MEGDVQGVGGFLPFFFLLTRIDSGLLRENIKNGKTHELLLHKSENSRVCKKKKNETGVNLVHVKPCSEIKKRNCVGCMDVRLICTYVCIEGSPSPSFLGPA